MSAERVELSIKNVVEGVKTRILTSWKDERVARWVISQLPLLELAGSHPPVPIFDLDFESGLTVHAGDASLLDKFRNMNKVVISGGFEGNNGHVLTIKSVCDVARILSMSEEKYITALLIESDDYVRQIKHREPMLTFEERKKCWSESGLVDCVVGLPIRDFTEDAKNHYERVHSFIKPAKWCASIENPSWEEIVTRDSEIIMPGISLFDHEAEVHMSFLDSTKGMSLDELLVALSEYSYWLADVTTTDQLLQMYGGKDRYTKLLFERIAGKTIDRNGF